MTALAPMADELDRWSAEGRTATFWWRDDDAVEPTPALDRLLAATEGIPLALAVIPGPATGALAERLENYPAVTVLHHGWMHADHALEPPSSEYPGHRAEDEVRAEIEAGRERLAALFGDRFLPVFAPPWHGFDERFAPVLERCGLTGLSRKGPRPSRRLGGLALANVHAVPILWTSPPRFGEAGLVVEALCRHLRERRVGSCDADEPTGILTHHLVQDEDSYAFLAEMTALVAAHPAAAWVGAETIFAQDAG